MNNYPSWWNDTLTVYNKYIDPITKVIKWYKHTVTGCFWKYTGNKVNVGNVILETDNVICRIPKSDSFLERHLWVEKPNDEMDNYFTLGKDDIIIRGEIDDEIDEYKSGSRSSDIVNKYKDLQGCMRIARWTINVDGGRANEHYYVKGT